MNMYTATQGAPVSRFVVKSSPSLSDGLMTLNIQMHISWRAEKQNKRGKVQDIYSQLTHVDWSGFRKCHGTRPHTRNSQCR